jgi:hypothetical protein
MPVFTFTKMIQLACTKGRQTSFYATCLRSDASAHPASALTPTKAQSRFIPSCSSQAELEGPDQDRQLMVCSPAY